MVGAVNGVSLTPMIQRQAVAVRDPAPGARRAWVQDRDSADAASEILVRVRKAEMESLLASMALAPPGAHNMAAHTLEEAERKLVRLKAEAQAAAASRDRRAARAIARDLATLARQIADAAQDYAVAQVQPDVVSPALAQAAARMNAASVPAEAASEEPGSAEPEAAAGDRESRPAQQPADQDLASVAAPPSDPPSSGSGGAHEAGILVKAHRLFEEAVDLLRAMEALISRQSSWAGRIGLDAPTVLPIWPVAIGSAGAGQPTISAPLPVASHGR